jgi:BMFP domain-containing protein YqiC
MAEPIDWTRVSPVVMFRDWVAKSEAQWSESISKMLKDEFACGLLNRQVEEARQMQRMVTDMAQPWLAAMNLPSRSDFEALDARLGRIEDGQAALSAALVGLRAAAEPGARRAADAVRQPRPPRTRKPVAAWMAALAESETASAASSPAPARAARKSAKAR